jgi:hypothetical protein
MHHQSAHVQQRRQEVAALYLSGKYQSEIARLIGVSQQQVSHDLQAVQRAWLASSIRDFDAAKAEQLAKIDAVERAAWGAWERSVEPRDVVMTKEVSGDFPRTETTTRREQPVGDPRFLERIQKCIEQRCDILGLSTATEAAKAVSTGLAALLAQAKGTPPGATSMAEA